MKELIEQFGIQNIIIYLIIINIIGFFIMGVDKWKAKNNAWRIPENSLFTVAFIGGAIGIIAGMYTFRHKTQKSKFTIGVPAILILEIILIIYLSVKGNV